MTANNDKKINLAIRKLIKDSDWINVGQPDCDFSISGKNMIAILILKEAILRKFGHEYPLAVLVDMAITDWIDGIMAKGINRFK